MRLPFNVVVPQSPAPSPPRPITVRRRPITAKAARRRGRDCIPRWRGCGVYPQQSLASQSDVAYRALWPRDSEAPNASVWPRLCGMADILWSDASDRKNDTADVTPPATRMSMTG
jgi:hypothetical protein